MDLNQVLRSHESLIRTTALRYARRFRSSRHIETPDDLIAEARIAAWKAIENYQEGRKAKIETFIVACIGNRMADLQRKAFGRSKHGPARPQLTFLDPLEITVEADLAASVDPTDAMDDRATLQAVLDEEELEVLTHLMDGGAINDLVYVRCRKKSLGRNQSRCEVVACLHRIQHKLKSRGLSLSV